MKLEKNTKRNEKFNKEIEILKKKKKEPNKFWS